MHIFIQHHIDDQTLIYLTEDELKQLTQISLGDRIKILNWLAVFQQSSPMGPSENNKGVANQNKNQEEKQDEKGDDGDDDEDEDEEDDGKNCCCCYERKANMAFIPCGHLSMCEECTKKKNDTCPICNTPGRCQKIFL